MAISISVCPLANSDNTSRWRGPARKRLFSAIQLCGIADRWNLLLHDLRLFNGGTRLALQTELPTTCLLRYQVGTTGVISKVTRNKG